MSSSNPILTIGIPTWNRKHELQECLNLVVPQALAEEGVEVMVCDNASDDGTQPIIEDLVRRCPVLRYERNQTNIGADRNFVEVLRRASGTYVWILSDDDFLTDGAVRQVLKIIKGFSPSYVSVNYVYCDSQRQITQFQPDQRYMIKEDVPHADINRTFLVRNHWLSFLSCSIYRRDLVDFDDILDNREKVPNWIQMYMTAQVVARGKDAYHSSCNAVLARVGNDRVDSTPFVAYMPEAMMHIFRKFHVDEEVRNSVIKGIRETFLSFPTFLAYRARGLSPSPLIVPAHYKIGFLFPRSLLLGMRKIYRACTSQADARQ
jgi:glycosyltransferase involved in cell wall biosynthesis